jgi:beta-lactamase regulating signal transducer with metallopeptidase domain/Skp family chaperone for outer membrane proteins
MNDSLSLLPALLARTSVWTLLAGLLTLLLLRVFHVRSTRVERLAWTIVLCQGWLLWQYPIEMPRIVEMLATPESGTAPYAVTIMANCAEGLQDDDTVWAATAPTEEIADWSLSAAFGQETSLPAIKSPSPHWALWLAGVWLVGGLMTAAIPIAGYVRFVRGLGEFEPAPRDWAAQWEGILREAGVAESIPICTSHTCGPLLCRLPRGYVVIVPRQIWGALTARQRWGVLLHELAHYQRGDVWKSMAARLLAWPQWFNPFIWHALRRFDECAERACDERVQGASPDAVTDYARALLVLAHPSGRPALASAASGRDLAARVRRLLCISNRKESRMKAICVCTALIVVTGLGAIRPDSSAAGNDTSPGAAESQPAPVAAADGVQSVGSNERANEQSARQSGSQPGSDEAYVDVKRLFDEEPGFKAGREQLKRSLADADVELKRIVEELRSLSIRVRDADADGEAGQKERDRLQREAQDATAALESKRESLKSLALERETGLYRETYERIRAAVADYARDNGIRIVKRKQAAVPERLDAAPNPQDMIRLMNQDVIFNADEPWDITEPVLQTLKARAAEAK